MDPAGLELVALGLVAMELVALEPVEMEIVQLKSGFHYLDFHGHDPDSLGHQSLNQQETEHMDDSVWMIGSMDEDEVDWHLVAVGPACADLIFDGRLEGTQNSDISSVERMH